jgi:hypothetical protein
MSDDALSRRLRQIREAEALPELEPMPEAASEEELEATAPPRRKPLGELLVGKGLISDEALEASSRKSTGGRSDRSCSRQES